jgi:hypothetical protein
MQRADALSALVEGYPRSTPYRQTVHHLGDIVLPSGRLEASDPFTSLGEAFVFDVPAGTFPVRLTVADVSDAQDGSHLREAYLSVVFAAGEPTRAEVLVPSGAEPPADDEFYGVPVDAGTVAFADREAIARCMPSGNWYEGLFDDGSPTSWFALMDSPDHLVAGSANVVIPGATAGENVVLAHSGWGDGFYPVLGSYDATGHLLGVHIDLLVAGPDDDDDEPRTAPHATL